MKVRLLLVDEERVGYPDVLDELGADAQRLDPRSFLEREPWIRPELPEVKIQREVLVRDTHTHTCARRNTLRTECSINRCHRRIAQFIREIVSIDRIIVERSSRPLDPRNHEFYPFIRGRSTLGCLAYLDLPDTLCTQPYFSRACVPAESHERALGPDYKSIDRLVGSRRK